MTIEENWPMREIEVNVLERRAQHIKCGLHNWGCGHGRMSAWMAETIDWSGTIRIATLISMCVRSAAVFIEGDNAMIWWVNPQRHHSHWPRWSPKLWRPHDLPTRPNIIEVQHNKRNACWHFLSPVFCALTQFLISINESKLPKKKCEHGNWVTKSFYFSFLFLSARMGFDVQQCCYLELLTHN